MSRPLQFLHVTTFYPPYNFGGDGIFVHRLAHALGDAGHHSDVVFCTDSYRLAHRAEPQIVFGTHPRVTLHPLRSGYGWLSPLLSHQTGRPYLKTTSIRQLLARKRFDVIHYHNI
jgi:hypothetical protein